MAFVRRVVIEYLAEHLLDRGTSQTWLIERLKADLTRDPEISDEELHGPEWAPVVNRLISLDREFQEFVDDKYKERFIHLTEPLVTSLKTDSSRKYYSTFKVIADELFLGTITWIRIVTFLAYNCELINRILTELPRENKEKTFKMVSQVIKCICLYFEENLLQWIEKQNGGWNNIIVFTERAAENNKNGSGGLCHGAKQYIGVAALAAIFGGLYLCSKITIQ